MKALEDIIELDRLPRFLQGINYRGDNGCWVWQRGKSTDGYGMFRALPGQHNSLVHRVMYEMRNDAIPQGMQIDHLCRNRACCNPAHLEVVSPHENVRRGISPAARNMAKTHCSKCNIEYDYISPAGGRACRKCRYEHVKAWRARKKAK